MSTAAPAEHLTGLLLTLADRTLLLPNAAVAELVPCREIRPLPVQPDWCLGQVAWRDLRLPLISFEALSSGSAAQFDGDRHARVAILNALGGRERVRFLALLIRSIPRSLRITLELGAVAYEGGTARIPDLIGVEERLAAAGVF